MRSRVVAEPIKSATEHDAIRCRHMYCYTENRPAIVAWAKRQIHKRARRRERDEVLGELTREAQEMGLYT